MSDKTEPTCPKCGGLIAFVTEAPRFEPTDDPNPPRPDRFDSARPAATRPSAKKCECSPPVY